MVAGNTKAEMLGYYLASAFIAIVLITHPEYDVAYHINQGVLQNYLIKPQSFIHYILVNEFSYKFNRMIVGVPGMILMYLIVTQLFHIKISFVFFMV